MCPFGDLYARIGDNTRGNIAKVRFTLLECLYETPLITHITLNGQGICGTCCQCFLPDCLCCLQIDISNHNCMILFRLIQCYRPANP
ncbi:Uncharacterised protein [Klebsiella variicola]|nr:Uncharacterised protein [Klebsiella variicola]